MVVVLGLAIGLILAGLLMVVLAPKVTPAILATVVYWVGIILVVVGLILLVSPVLIWLSAQIKAALGAQ